MSSQVGKFTRAMSLTPVSTLMKSDTVNIPYAGTNYRDGTVTTITTNKLIDAAANFLTTGANPLCVKVGDIVWNNTTGNCAYVTNVDSATQLSLSFNAFGTLADAYRLFSASDLYFGSTISCYLYIGVAGIVKVLTPAGDVVQFPTVAAGSILPVQASRLYSATTATGIIALW